MDVIWVVYVRDVNFAGRYDRCDLTGRSERCD